MLLGEIIVPKFYKNWSLSEDSWVLTRLMFTTNNERRKGDHKSSPLECSYQMSYKISFECFNKVFKITKSAINVNLYQILLKKRAI